MAEVLAQFTPPVVSGDGTAYRAQAVGAPMDDGRWEAWIEFIPGDGDELDPRLPSPIIHWRTHSLRTIGGAVTTHDRRCELG